MSKPVHREALLLKNITATLSLVIFIIQHAFKFSKDISDLRDLK